LAQDELFVTLEATPTIDTSAYAAGDLMGSAAIELPLAAAQSKRGAIIQSVLLCDDAAQTADIDVLFFDDEPETDFSSMDNAAADIDDADLHKLVGCVSVTDWKSFNDNSMGQSLNVALPFVLAAGPLWAVLVSRGAGTYAATGLTLRVGVMV
jgi:hypothetical protein